MATLALSAIGSYLGGSIGGYLGSAAIGSAVGYAAGSLLGQSLETLPGVQGPRLDSLKATDSQYGTPIKKVYGSVRVGGSVIWQEDLEEISNTQTTGGKGGPSQAVTTYSYYGYYAVHLCEGPVVGVSKIWADGILIYDVSDKSNVEALYMSSEISKNITVYTGTETQNPDPTIESYKGIGNVPAFRGQCYIVFDKMLLEKFGNRVPVITAEVVENGTLTSMSVVKDIVGADIDYFNSVEQIYLNDGVIKTWVADTTPGDYTQAGAWYRPTAHPRYYYYDIAGNYLRHDDDLSQDKYTLNIFMQEASYLLGFVGLYQIEGDGTTIGSIRVYDGGGNQYIVIRTTDISDNAGSGIGAWPTSSQDYLLLTVRDTSENVVAYKIYNKSLDEIRSGSITGLNINPTIASSAFSVSDDLSVIWVTIANDTTNSAYRYNATTGNYELIESYSISGGNFVRIIGNNYLAWKIYESKITIFTIMPTVVITAQTLDNVVSDLSIDAGLTAGQIDVTALTDTIDGFVIDRTMTARGAIDALRQAYFFDFIEVDGKLKAVKRGGATEYAITDNFLAVHTAKTTPDKIMLKRVQETELPKRVTVSYLNRSDDYQINSQYSARLITSSVNEASIQVPIVLTDDEAAQIVEILLFNAWSEREQFDFTLPLDYIDLIPSSIISVTADGVTYLIRITSIDNNGAFLQCSGVQDITDYTSTIEGGGTSGTGAQVPGIAGPTIYELLDINMVRDADNSLGFYIAANGYFSKWPNATIFSSADDDLYNNLLTVNNGAVMGAATDALADGTKNRIDRANTVNVSLYSYNASLSSITEAQLLNLGNAAVLGDEIIKFQTATLEADGTYTLSNLLRARRGSEFGTHAAGDKFILLSDTTIYRVDQELSQLDVSRYYKGVTGGSFLQNSSSTQFANTGNALKPWSPVSVKGSRDGSNNLTITWLRRSRVTTKTLNSPLLYEDSESYEVDIIVAGSPQIVRTIAVTAETASYTAAQQTTDGITPGDAVTVRVYQLSATVGRGYTREQII